MRMMPFYNAGLYQCHRAACLFTRPVHSATTIEQVQQKRNPSGCRGVAGRSSKPECQNTSSADRGQGKKKSPRRLKRGLEIACGFRLFWRCSIRKVRLKQVVLIVNLAPDRKGVNLIYPYVQFEYRKVLASCGWSTPDTYGGPEYAEPTNSSACYLFLCTQREMLGDVRARCFVAYVGMTTQLLTRWSGHEILRLIPSDKFYTQKWFIPVPEGELRSFERGLIEKHNPPWNIVGKKRGIHE